MDENDYQDLPIRRTDSLMGQSLELEHNADFLTEEFDRLNAFVNRLLDEAANFDLLNNDNQE